MNFKGLVAGMAFNDPYPLLFEVSNSHRWWLTIHPQNSQADSRGKVSEGTFEGQNYVRWQIDVNGASRVWYFVDAIAYGVKQKKRSGRVIIDQVYFGHPKQTE